MWAACARLFWALPRVDQLVPMPPMMRCTRCPTSAPCAGYNLLEWVATGDRPADLGAVLDEVVEGHRGYFKLRRLVMDRLKVRQGASGRLGCEQQHELPDALPFPNGESNQRQCEQAATACTARG